MQTDQLASLIEQKWNVLRQLRALANRQTQLVEQVDLSRLLSLLAAKQTLLSQLQEVERQLDPFRGQDPETRRWRSAAVRAQTRQRASECQELLQEIMHTEQACEARLCRRRDEAATRLQGAHDLTQARSAYLQAGMARSGRLDLSSET